jgi:hypothetical protein
VALKDIPPGTLILSEEPFIEWPEDTHDLPLHVAVVKGILGHGNAREVRRTRSGGSHKNRFWFKLRTYIRFPWN